MASTFECLGFALDGPDDLPALLDALRPSAQFEGRFGGVDIRWWEDPTSGARVSFGERDGALEFLLPSLAAPATVRLARLEARGPEVFGASVLGASGDRGVALTFEVEEHHLLHDGLPEVVDAAIVAFGNSVTVSSSADAETNESLQPVGEAVAAAMLSGVVVGSGTRVNSVTGDSFHVAQVRVGEREISLCLSAREFAVAPAAGDVVRGSSFVVVSIPSLREPRPALAAPAPTAPASSERRRWWKR